MITPDNYKAIYKQMNHGFIYEESEANGSTIGFFRAKQLKEQFGVEHGFTARSGGVSLPPYDSLHLNFKKPHNEEHTRENFRRFCVAAGIEYDSMAVINYEHGNTVLRLDRQDRGKGFDRPALPPCDGLITNDPYITLITNHADCGAFFILDPVKKAVGIAHSGWKGTLGLIGKNTVEAMIKSYGCNPEDMIAATGPCICQNCYEVDSALAERFDSAFGIGVCTKAGREGHAYLSIETAQAIQLVQVGIKAENITLMEKCTFEDKARLFSHRRDSGALGGTGDMAGYIKLSELSERI